MPELGPDLDQSLSKDDHGISHARTKGTDQSLADQATFGRASLSTLLSHGKSVTIDDSQELEDFRQFACFYLFAMAARRTRALPARNTLTDENAPTTRSRTTAVVKPGVSASNAPVKPSMSRTTSSASTVVVRKPVSTATAGKGDVNAKQPTAGTSRMAGTKQEAGVRNRAALGELTNKDAVNVTNGDKPKVAGGKTTSTVTGRPIIARRTTRSSLATTDKPAEGVVEPTAGPSRSTITSTARARPAARTRPSAKNVNVKEEAVKREPLVGKATSSTVNNARAGIKRTLTATTVVQPSAPVPEAAPVRLERQTSVKREFEEPQGDDLENPIQPSSKRIRTSSPVKRDDAEFEREPEFEHGLVDVQEEQVRPAATREAGVDALEDEQPYELEEDAIGMSGGRLGDIVQDIDADDSDDPTMVVEYVQDIFNYMKELEDSCMPNTEYMEQQPHLKWEMRGLLTDWLIEVHHKFRLLPETLFLAVNLVDRFLSARVVSLAKLQLVGLTCLFIAAKYEEVICPTVSNFLFMADGGYTDDEILSAEKYVLTTLEFDLSYPNPMHFLRRVSKAEGYDIQTRTLAKYLMEMSCVDHRFLGYPPSLLAAAGVWMARLVLDRSEWDATLTHYSSYTEAEILPVAQLMLNYTLDRNFPSNDSFYRKYSSRKYMKAAVFVRDWAVRVWPRQAAGVKKTGHELYEIIIERERNAKLLETEGGEF